MDQIKIGNFIQEKRKEKNITQSSLAEILNISDRAVSKWENGVCLPDAGKMTELCDILGITLNDLFSGEKVDMKDNEKKYEENLLEMTRQKEEAYKRLLKLEIVIGIFGVIFMLSNITIAALIEMEDWIRGVLIATGLITFLILAFFAIRIEQKAGYYECGECHTKYVPTYNSVLWAMHINRTRFMKCPNCGKRSWQRKVISK